MSSLKYEDVKERVICGTDGHPIGYRSGAKGIIGLVWLVGEYLRLPVEAVEIGDDPDTADHWLAFKPGSVQKLNEMQTGAIWAYWRQCKEITLGHRRGDTVYFPDIAHGIIDGQPKAEALVFSDQGRAEMCRAMCWDVFGLNAELVQCRVTGGWLLNVKDYSDGNRRLTIYDEYRLQGACSLLARHTIAPASYALPNAAIPSSPPPKPASESPALVRRRAGRVVRRSAATCRPVRSPSTIKRS